MQDKPNSNQEQEQTSDAVRGSGHGDDGLLVNLDAAGHALKSDEPVGHGGENRGPSPYDYLSAALASCTIMTLHMYARHKDWPLEAVHAEVRHGKIHARDCEDCADKKGKVDRFDRVLQLKGDLDDEQRKRLLQIADRCPVHRTLNEQVEIRTRLAD